MLAHCFKTIGKLTHMEQTFAGHLASQSLLAGVVATLAADGWTLMLKAITGRSPGNWALVGRWLVWTFRGVFVHHPITTTPAVPGESAVGWIFHYAVGIIYAALYLSILGLGFGSGATLVSAMVFALILLAAPWFIMQPALGLGFMAARAPNPAIVRVINVSVHAWFGIGLYVGAWLAGAA